MTFGNLVAVQMIGSTLLEVIYTYILECIF